MALAASDARLRGKDSDLGLVIAPDFPFDRDGLLDVVDVRFEVYEFIRGHRAATD